MNQELINNIIKQASSQDGTSWLGMGKLNDGLELCLVFGWDTGYDEGEAYQMRIGNTLYTLCSKLAVNIDDLQADFDVDWYMPYAEDGEVYDTCMAVAEPFNYEWYKEQAKTIIEKLNNNELEV